MVSVGTISVFWTRYYFLQIRIREDVNLNYGSRDPGGQLIPAGSKSYMAIFVAPEKHLLTIKYQVVIHYIFFFFISIF